MRTVIFKSCFKDDMQSFMEYRVATSHGIPIVWIIIACLLLTDILQKYLIMMKLYHKQ